MEEHTPTCSSSSCVRVDHGSSSASVRQTGGKGMYGIAFWILLGCNSILDSTGLQ
jgi:hypothetical protein